MKRTLLAGLVGAVVTFQVTANVDRVRYLTEGITFESGAGSPEGVVTALPGSGYYNGADGNHWRKLSGSGAFGWVNVSQPTSNLIFLAGACQGTTAVLGFSTPTSNPAVAACVTGSNTNTAVLQFANGASALSIQNHFALPSPDSDGRGAWVAGTSIDVDGKWRTSATSGSVVWQIQTAYVCDGATIDPAFNSAQTVTDAAKGSANQLNDFQIFSLSQTGASPGCELFWKLSRDPAHGSDDLAATAELLYVRFIIRRQG